MRRRRAIDIKSMLFVGIDPGKKGAFGRIICNGNGNNVDTEVIDMPTYQLVRGGGKNKKKKDIVDAVEVDGEFAFYIEQYKNIYIVIENTQPMPKQGVVSAHTLGRQIEMLATNCRVLDISHMVISPKRWQKMFGISGKDGDTKGQSYQVASRLFPNLVFRGPRNGLLDGRCDAMLMAEYGRRTHSGTTTKE